MIVAYFGRYQLSLKYGYQKQKAPSNCNMVLEEPLNEEYEENGDENNIMKAKTGN